MEYGTRLRMMRMARGILQRDLERQIGLPYTTLSPIERGRTVPSPELGAKIRRVLAWTEREDAALEMLEPVPAGEGEEGEPA